MKSDLRGWLYVFAVVVGLLAAVGVLFKWFTPDEVQAALLVLGIVTAAVAGLARKYLSPDAPEG